MVAVFNQSSIRTQKLSTHLKLTCMHNPIASISVLQHFATCRLFPLSNKVSRCRFLQSKCKLPSFGLVSSSSIWASQKDGQLLTSQVRGKLAGDLTHTAFLTHTFSTQYSKYVQPAGVQRMKHLLLTEKSGSSFAGFHTEGCIIWETYWCCDHWRSSL